MIIFIATSDQAWAIIIMFTLRHCPYKEPNPLQFTESGIHCSSSEKKNATVQTKVRQIIVHKAALNMGPWNILDWCEYSIRARGA